MVIEDGVLLARTEVADVEASTVAVRTYNTRRVSSAAILVHARAERQA